MKAKKVYRDDNAGRSYRISSKNKIVVYVPGRKNTFGDQGSHNRIIALPHPDLQSQYIAEFGAHRDDIKSAAESLNVTIHRHTKKNGHEIFRKTENGLEL